MRQAKAPCATLRRRTRARSATVRELRAHALTPPGARGSGKRLLAVSDEEGSVTFLDVDAPETYSHGAYLCSNALTHAERLRATIKTHDNAVFDVKWSADDRLIATASGDQTVGITDVTTQHAIGRAVGHTCTVKQVAWDPFNPCAFAQRS